MARPEKEPHHIRWRDIIEMPANTDPEILRDLDRLENTAPGQQQFRRAAAALKHALPGAYAQKPAYTAPTPLLDTIYGLRREAPKIFLYAQNSEEARISEFGPTNGFYEQENNILVLDLSTLKHQTTLPMQHKDGTQSLEREPLIFILSHEIQHAVDLLETRWSPKTAALKDHIGKATERGCLEESAMAAANALKAEIAPNEPIRLTYVGSHLAIKPFENAEISPELAKQMKEWITLDAGCTGLSPKEATRAAHELWKQSGVTIATPEEHQREDTDPTKSLRERLEKARGRNAR